MIKIITAVINYKCEAEVLKYAKELNNQSAKKEVFLVIVDNLSSVDLEINLLDELNKLDINFDIFYPKTNLGYLNGVLFGIDEYVKKYNEDFSWITVSNTDIIIKDEHFYEKFLNINYDGEIWCVAPSVTNQNSTKYSNPQYKNRLSLKKVNRIINIFKFPFLAKMYIKLASIKSKKKESKQESQYVYSSHGSFFFLRKEFYKYLNGEKYGAFLYSEENYIAEQILKASKKEYYDAGLEVIHYEKLSTGKIAFKRKCKMMSESMQYIKEKFYN